MGSEDIVLSIVAASRNDDHGGDPLRRTQIFINGILAHAADQKAKVELILVDWNPPPDRPSLWQALKWPKSHPYCSVRAIQVPGALHQRYKYAQVLPFYQMIAKNAGIRRARGRFILATNIDILFSKELFHTMVAGQLQVNRLYRANRVDVDTRIPLDASLEEQLTFCRQNTLRINHRYGSINTDLMHYFPLCGLNVDVAPSHYEVSSPYLFFNACGDYQLLAREDWYKLHGYAEFDTYSMHLDSIFELTAQFGNAPEEILPEEACAYHIEHTSGFVPEKYTFQKFEKARILDWETIRNLAIKMTWAEKPIIFNDEEWGFGGEVLPEAMPVRADWDTTFQADPAPAAEVASPVQPGHLTIFTLPQAFVGPDAIIQREAIGSWLQLEPRPEVILFGDAPGTRALAQEWGLRHVPFYEETDYGSPMVNHLFDRAQVLARHDLLMYVQPGVKFGAGMAARVRQAAERFPALVIYPAAAEPAWLLFRRWTWRKIPPFALGAGGWGDWLVAQARAQGVAVIEDRQGLEIEVNGLAPQGRLAERPRTRLLEGQQNQNHAKELLAPGSTQNHWILTPQGVYNQDFAEAEFLS